MLVRFVVYFVIKNGSQSIFTQIAHVQCYVQLKIIESNGLNTLHIKCKQSVSQPLSKSITDSLTHLFIHPHPYLLLQFTCL